MGRMFGSHPSHGHKHRHLDILQLEQAILSGEHTAIESVLAKPQADLLASPLLSKVYGESLIASGCLREGVSWLSQAVKGLAAQGMQHHWLEALAGLAMVYLRTGNDPEATTILRFLNNEVRGSRSEVGIIAHVLAAGIHLLEPDADQAPYVQSAFDAYTQASDFTSYGMLLLDVWTEFVPGDALERWEDLLLWAEQQARLKHRLVPFVQAVHGLACFHAARWEEAAEHLAQTDFAALGHYRALIVRCYRFLACCRSESLARQLTANDYEGLIQALRSSETDLILLGYASMVQGEWGLLRSDASETEKAIRQAASLRPLIRLPGVTRMLAAWEARMSQAQRLAEAQTVKEESAIRPGWRIYCFGGLRLICDGTQIGPIPWKRRKTKELFIYLLLQPRYESPRDQTAERLFADAEPGKAANRLYVAIHELKRSIRDHLGLDNAVAIKEGMVRLDERLVGYLDVEQYAMLARVGERLWRHDRELALEMFEQASQLYEALLPEMLYVDWLDQHREQLEETQSGMLKRLALHASGEQNGAKAESYLSEWLQLKPLQEEAHHEMIALLMREGRNAEALQWYADWEQTCIRELGLPPAPETGRLVAGVRR